MQIGYLALAPTDSNSFKGEVIQLPANYYQFTAHQSAISSQMNGTVAYPFRRILRDPLREKRINMGFPCNGFAFLPWTKSRH
jgi:hypothetical protein